MSTGWQPSALRLLVTAVVGLMAPLFWPGNAATPARTATRIAGWSAAAAVLAAIALRIFGGPLPAFSRLLASCSMLLLILLVTHGVAAGLEARWRGRCADASNARELAGRTSAIALVLLGSLPLWLGPMSELLSDRFAWAIDTVIGVSPLTHLAVASGNDLLRNQWFYQHSNLAGLQFSYPTLAELTWFYASLILVLWLAALACLGRRPHIADGRSHFNSEKLK
jgi:hypothetical protein